MATIAEERDKHLRKVRRKLDELLDILDDCNYEETPAELLRNVDRATELATSALLNVQELLGEDFGTPPEQMELDFEFPEFPDTTELGDYDND